MRLARLDIPISAGTTGDGTATTFRPLCGHVVEFRVGTLGTALNNSGSTDWTVTRVEDGGTILSAANQTAPFQYQPRNAVHTSSAGTTAYGLGQSPVFVDPGIPVDGYVQVVVAQAGTVAKAGTVHLYVQEGGCC
jgi:hypothetical protein